MSRFFSQKKDTKTKDTLKKPVFSSSDFPDLVTSTNPNSKNTNTSIMNYKNKLEVIEPKLESTIKPGHISLFYDKITKKLCIEKETFIQKSKQQQQYPSTPTFEKLVKHWETWYDDYIELYGEDIYENVHLYPFYNYNYFNELDEIFYRELEELEKTEEAEYEDYDDYP